MKISRKTARQLLEKLKLQKMYEKAYEVLCKRCNGALYVTPDNLIAIQDEMHTVAVLYSRFKFDKQIAIPVKVKKTIGFNFMHNVVETLLENAKTSDIEHFSNHKWNPVMRKDETLENLLIEGDLNCN